MPKFIKPFKGLVKGDRYKTDFFAGDECPESLLDEARDSGALPPAKKTKKGK